MAPYAFITGSHAYGTPTADSDVDLVVLIDHDDAHRLLAGIADKYDDDHQHNYGHGVSNLRFGKLNIICCYDDVEFQLWRQATDDLNARRPVTRDEAVEYIHKMRESINVR